MSDRSILLATPYFPPSVGGVEQYVWHLARELRVRHGHRVVIATTATTGVPGSEPGRSEDGPGGATVYRLPAPLRLSRTPYGTGWRRMLRQIIDDEDVALVNGHAPVPFFADTAAHAAGTGTPFVLTYHTGRMRKGRLVPDLALAAYERTVLADTAHRAQEIICSSDYVAADLPSLFAGRTTTISPGVDLTTFTPSAVPAEPRILFAGSLEQVTSYKGLADLMRAVAGLRPSVPGVRLDVVGAGSAADGYRRLAGELGLADRVTFTGRLDGDRLAEAYRRARVLALPTSYDSFPSVLVEAMASGRPVVTTPVGGIPSLVRHEGNGLLVEPGDHEGLIAALRRVLTEDGLAERLGASGRRHTERELSWTRQADRTEEIFDRVLRRRRTRTVAVVAPYYPPKVGGVENYAARITRAVADDPALRAVVITTNTAGRRTRVTVDGGVPVVRLGTWARLSNTPMSPLWPLQLRRWMRRMRVDVVNAHAPVPGLGDVAVTLSGRRPAVLTYHAGSMRKGTSGAVDRVIDLYERHVLPRVFDRVETLVAVSPVSLAAGRAGAVQITPGVDIDRFTPGPVPPSGRPRTVVYVGRMDRTSAWKGVDVLLEAFARLDDDTELILVGGGDAVPDHLQRAARLAVEDRVTTAGELTGEALVDVLRQAAVVVLPSRTEAESFGMVLAEAMACGTPVVGSAVGGIPHVVRDEHDGVLVPPGDPDALAAACRRILTDGALADRLGTAGRRSAVERFAWPALTDQYLRLFKSLA
ncbi:glycosyltransferase family 4 protein [Streptomyces gilvus]|uniref:glycosyltransferase family 4 protein n=1 Tax=Streptomyces gilvus TaxID=2920937 RepID=UPI001F0ECEEA|nr:glycosyltransferase family 4 protein [Streptomyces sp. CME 23]MCH5673541.1 glycosyltransferase family 4 protein [Streptomyces sp. CME 23]